MVNQYSSVLVLRTYLLGLTKIFQLTEQEAEKKLCRDSREKVVKYKRELAISSFYEFGYNKRLCKVLKERLQSGRKFSAGFLKRGFASLVQQNCTKEAINVLSVEASKRNLQRQWVLFFVLYDSQIRILGRRVEEGLEAYKFEQFQGRRIQSIWNLYSKFTDVR